MSAYDPQSNDAMFSRVLSKLDEHSTILDEIKQQGISTEKRVSSLETLSESMKGKVALVAALASAAVAGASQVVVSMFTEKPH